MENVKVTMSADIGQARSPAYFEGEFLINMNNPVMDNMRLERDGDGYIVHYHDLRFRISEKDREDAFRFLAIKDYDAKEAAEIERAKYQSLDDIRTEPEKKHLIKKILNR